MVDHFEVAYYVLLVPIGIWTCCWPCIMFASGSIRDAYVRSIEPVDPNIETYVVRNSALLSVVN